MTKFKIIIFKVTTETKTVQEYEKLRDRLPGDASEDNYGYVTREKAVTEEAKIYEQITENTVDLKGIIDAFNEQPADGGTSDQPKPGGGSGSINAGAHGGGGH